MKYLAKQWFAECRSTADIIVVFVSEFIFKAMPQTLLNG